MYPKMKKLLSLLLALSLVLALTACGSKDDGANDADTQDDAAESVELIVFAAASMTETLNEIAEMYKEVAPNVTLTFNFDSSGKLLTQISEGADCDLFISVQMADHRIEILGRCRIETGDRLV